tara:strand:+ start:563 stop:1543 length:981 start_codon:yes stop_codon:yes gene_type:complete
MAFHVYTGDVLDSLDVLESGSVDCCVTSPPYWGLRDYGVTGQIGLEATPDEYVARMVEVFAEVRRVLRDDGTLWLNLGDSYAGSWGNQGRKEERGTQRPINGGMLTPVHDGRYPSKGSNTGACPPGLKPKDLIGIPWRVAFALQADGWYLRSDIIWHKPNPMPESVTDRPTRSHEYLFLLSKSQHYHYDHEAIKEPSAEPGRIRRADPVGGASHVERGQHSRGGEVNGVTANRNRRSVWTIPTRPFKGAHFAVFPLELVSPCIQAGSREGGTVLDPFTGSGSTGVVAGRLFRDFVGIELNPEYAEMARRRIRDDMPLFREVRENGL